MIDNAHALVNHSEFDPFGKILKTVNASRAVVNSNTLAIDAAFAGREWDDEAGLYYNRARWYDAAEGRFISEDPLGLAAGDASVYRYAAGDPVNFRDPSGESLLAIAGSAALFAGLTWLSNEINNEDEPITLAFGGSVDSGGNVEASAGVIAPDGSSVHASTNSPTPVLIPAPQSGAALQPSGGVVEYPTASQQLGGYSNDLTNLSISGSPLTLAYDDYLRHPLEPRYASGPLTPIVVDPRTLPTPDRIRLQEPGAIVRQIGGAGPDDGYAGRLAEIAGYLEERPGSRTDPNLNLAAAFLLRAGSAFLGGFRVSPSYEVTSPDGSVRIVMGGEPTGETAVNLAMLGFKPAVSPGSRVSGSRTTVSAASSGERLAGSIRTVNPNFPRAGFTENCVECAIAVEKRFSGIKGYAAGATDGPLPVSLIRAEFGGTFQRVSGPQQIGSILSRSGHRSRGIVYARDAATGQGHVFNARFDHGTVRFLDSQLGPRAGLGVDNFDDFNSFEFLLTAPGR